MYLSFYRSYVTYLNLSNSIFLKKSEYKINHYIASSDQVINASKRISELESTLKKMSVRDVQEELLKHKLSILEEELSLKNKQMEELYHRYYNFLNKDKGISIKNSVNKITCQNFEA